jgi:hypothetical protein
MEQVAKGDRAVTIYVRAARKCTLLLIVLVWVLVASIALCGKALADGSPQIATATTQDLFSIEAITS